jgi:hypothetical protein
MSRAFGYGYGTVTQRRLCDLRDWWRAVLAYTIALLPAMSKS